MPSLTPVTFLGETAHGSRQSPWSAVSSSSLDRQTGNPPFLPPGVRTAYLQDTDEVEAEADLVFRTQKYRRRPLPLALTEMS